MTDDITYSSGTLASLTVHQPDGTTRDFSEVRVEVFGNRCLKVYRDATFSGSVPLETVFNASEWKTYDGREA